MGDCVSKVPHLYSAHDLVNSFCYLGSLVLLLLYLPDALVKHFKIEPGNSVLCDLCAKDYTDDLSIGGFIFLSKAVCPDCAPDFMEKVVFYREQVFVRAKCPELQSFAEFVRQYRKP
jgi:hypothetical protein